MAPERKVALTLTMTEGHADKLAKIAGDRDITMEECVIEWIEANSCLSHIEASLAQLESLSWMSLYWASLPYSDGLPKQKLNAEGMEQLWENAKAYANRFVPMAETPES